VHVVGAAIQVDMDLEGLPQRVIQFAIGSQRSGKRVIPKSGRLRRTVTGIADERVLGRWLASSSRQVHIITSFEPSRVGVVMANGPTRVQVSKLPLIRLSHFERRGAQIQCVEP
jgi:hypothetical protein